MICKVRETLSKFSMLEKTDEIIIGFSGGADSTCLLYILNALKDEFNIKIRAAHVNHLLRGDESERDEKFVRDFCDNNSIELSVLRVDVSESAKKSGKSIEECGREIRYNFFESLCSEHSKIATAHNLNDCEETMLLNLARGAGLKGLCSIPAVRNNIIRPLIDCSRDEIEEFCNNNSLDFVTDSSNLKDDYTRNKIRHNIIPVLKEINPSYDSSFLRCVNSLKSDEEYISSETDRLYDAVKLDFGFDAQKISKAHPALRNRVLSRIVCEKSGRLPEKIHLQLISSILNGGKTDVFDNDCVTVRNGILFFKSDIENKLIDETKIIFDADGKWSNDDISIELKNECTQNVYKELVLSTLDSDKINGNLILRKRRDGDKIKLPVRKVTKSLKKLLNELKIPPELRDNIYVLSDDTSVVWVEKIGADLRVAPDKNTKNYICITVSD